MGDGKRERPKHVNSGASHNWKINEHYFTSQILSGLDGLTSSLSAPDPVENPYETDAPYLPDSLLRAIQLFDRSKFYRTALGDAFVDYLSTIRQAEWKRYHLAVSEWEQAEYFGLY